MLQMLELERRCDMDDKEIKVGAETDNETTGGKGTEEEESKEA